MKTLDRYVVRTFLTSVFLAFVAFMLLRMMIDMFVNFDEYAEAGEFGNVLKAIGSYYGYQFFAYLLQLGGFIIVFAAVVTIWWMNHTNELTAILASGRSLHRVVMPIILLAILLEGILVIDQEVIVPRIAPKLVIDRGDFANMLAEEDVEGAKGTQFAVNLLCDGDRTAWYSRRFEQREAIMHQPVYMIRHRKQLYLVGVGLARGIAHATDSESYGKSGWLLEDATLFRMDRRLDYNVKPNTDRVHSTISGERILTEAINVAIDAGHTPPREGTYDEVNSPPMVRDTSYDMEIRADKLAFAPKNPTPNRTYRLINPKFSFFVETHGDGRRLLGTFVADEATWVDLGTGKRKYWDLTNGKLFYPTDLSPEELFMQQSGQWVTYMSSGQLARFLKSGKASNPLEVELTRYIRVTDPINNIIMLLLGLPFILSRERNLKASVLMCLLIVLLFFGFVYFCRFLGLPPFWGAFLPILLFGPISLAMLDSVKT
jgi:lipopolysaccharide export LptBFGC system permease protein LptF